MGAVRILSDPEARQIRIQLGHFSEKQLTGLLKSGRCKVDNDQIWRIYRECGFRRGVRRIHPLVSIWFARFSGATAAIDIARPFTDVGPDGLFPESDSYGAHSASMVIDSVTLFPT